MLCVVQTLIYRCQCHTLHTLFTPPLPPSAHTGSPQELQAAVRRALVWSCALVLLQAQLAASEADAAAALPGVSHLASGLLSPRWVHVHPVGAPDCAEGAPDHAVGCT